MSIFDYNADFFYIFIYYYVILVITVILIHKFHLRNPDTRSILFVKDEPMANKFIFAYGLATIPFIHILIIAVVALIYLLAFLVVFVFTLGGEFFIMDVPDLLTIFLPWYVDDGLSVIEIVAFLVAGYHIGYYSEETGWQIYINSVLVVTVYSILTNSMLLIYTQSGFTDLILIYFVIIILELLMIFIGTYIGNSKSKEDRSVEKYDPEIGLPAMKEYMRYVYIYSILIGMITISAIVTINIIDTVQSLMYILNLIIPIFTIYILAMVNLYQGDVNPENDKEKVIFIDPETGEVDDTEPLPVVSKIILIITALSVIIPITIFLIEAITIYT